MEKNICSLYCWNCILHRWHILQGSLPCFERNELTVTRHALLKKEWYYFPSPQRFAFLPDITLSLNNISSSKSVLRKIVLANISKITILPNQQEIIECKLDKTHPSLENIIGIIEPSLLFELKSGLCVIYSISKNDSSFWSKIGINLQPYKITVSPLTRNAKFQLVTQKQASYMLPIHPSIIECHTDLNKIIENKPTQQRDNYSSDNFWFSTPENCNNPSKLNAVGKTIYNTIKRFKQLELFDPTINEENRIQILEKIHIGWFRF